MELRSQEQLWWSVYIANIRSKPDGATWFGAGSMVFEQRGSTGDCSLQRHYHLDKQWWPRGVPARDSDMRSWDGRFSPGICRHPFYSASGWKLSTFKFCTIEIQSTYFRGL